MAAKILYPPVRKSTRPFGQGVIDPEPEPVTIERNLSPSTVPVTPPWEKELRSFLRSTGYAAWPTSHVIGAIRDGLTVGSIDPEILDPDDKQAAYLILARHGMAPRRRSQPYEPSEADRLEWSRDMNPGDWD